jgi:transposase
VRKTKELLRLHSLELTQHQIARSCAIAQSTVSTYLKAAEAAGIRWPDIADWDDARVEQALFPGGSAGTPKAQYAAPDYAAIHHELQTNRHVTLHLLWQEYREAHPEGYRYSRFCELYNRWRSRQSVVLRQQHRAGEKLFVDYAGDTIPIYDPSTGECRQAAVFVAVLGASSYTYAEATWTQSLPDWIGAHIRAFEFLGGLPEIVVPDNLKSGVHKPCLYEPDLNRTYQEMAAHYGVAVVPARARKPRDKAKVESGVLLVERWIMAALRKRRFHSLAEVNDAITDLLGRLNDRPFRKRDGTRRTQFDAVDKPVLRPLPAERYEFGHWRTARVNVDYHIEYERHYYSVPYQMTGQQVEVRASAATVEIFHRGVRIASHPRSTTPHQATTTPDHRPKAHQRHLEWTPSRLIEWAQTVGPATAALFEQIMASKPHPEMGYRSCLGVLRLGRQHSLERVEAAAKRAVALRACSYQSVKSILARGLDRLPVDVPAAPSPPVEHPNIRGAEYYDTGDVPPTIQ